MLKGLIVFENIYGAIMDRIVLKVAAKVNLYLKITGIRPDGYHNLDTLMSSVDIFDKVSVSKRNDNLINCFAGVKPCDEKNTAYIAAKLVSTSFNTKGVDIFIKKNIPYSAGLGGSSADAAAVLYAMNELYELGGLKNLEQTALEIGSDVPFMMYGGLARISEKGGTIEKMPFKFNYKLLIIKQKSGLSTRAVYNRYDKIPLHNIETLVNLDNIASFTNDLQSAAISLCPEIKENIKLLENSGAVKVLMAGSGSAVFGLFDDDKVLEKAHKELKNKIYYCKTANFASKGIFQVNV